MTPFADLIRESAAHAWLFVPSAVLLGALHGLEPGHSKTMMAAFIVAVRGTVAQAVLLGLAATLSHTLVVWGIALGGMFLWRGVDAEAFEPWFQLASAAIIIAVAIWMLWRTWRDERLARASAEAAGHAHAHAESASHGHRHGHAKRHGHVHGAHHHHHHDAHDHRHDAAVAHAHAHDHLHGHAHSHPAGGALPLAADGYQDAHERAHADDIRHRFSSRPVTTWQIVVFGLTGGLIPCPAAITVLLLCLQLEAFTLGFALVLCFSIGLAVTLVAVGVAAAVGARHADRRWPWLARAARRAPYLSGLLIVAVGLYVAWHGWLGLAARAATSAG